MHWYVLVTEHFKLKLISYVVLEKNYNPGIKTLIIYIEMIIFARFYLQDHFRPFHLQ